MALSPENQRSVSNAGPDQKFALRFSRRTAFKALIGASLVADGIFIKTIWDLNRILKKQQDAQSNGSKPEIELVIPTGNIVYDCQKVFDQTRIRQELQCEGFGVAPVRVVVDETKRVKPSM